MAPATHRARGQRLPLWFALAAIATGAVIIGQPLITDFMEKHGLLAKTPSLAEVPERSTLKEDYLVIGFALSPFSFREGYANVVEKWGPPLHRQKLRCVRKAVFRRGGGEVDLFFYQGELIAYYTTSPRYKDEFGNSFDADLGTLIASYKNKNLAPRHLVIPDGKTKRYFEVRQGDSPPEANIGVRWNTDQQRIEGGFLDFLAKC